MEKNKTITQQCPNCGAEVQGKADPTITDVCADIIIRTTVLVDPCPSQTSLMDNATKAVKNVITGKRKHKFVCPNCGQKWEVSIKLLST